jgi:hypothetical protein
MEAQKQFNIKPVLIIILMIPASTSGLDDADAHLNALSPIVLINIVTIIITDGTLKITYYWDTARNKIINFSGFNFIFRENNILTATNGTNTYNGTWSITDSTSFIDDLPDENFDLVYASSINTIETLDNWGLIDTSPPCIKLNEIIGDNGQLGILAFNEN